MVSPRTIPPTLVAQLSAALGRRSAVQELRWMGESSRDPSALEKMVARRLRGEPLQYILSTQLFGPLDLTVRSPVLIPRPETEEWAMRLAGVLPPQRSPTPQRLLDLCTGTGCIALLLCHLAPKGSMSALGVDIGDEAVQLAEQNAQRTGVPQPHDTRADRQNSFEVLKADILSDGFTATLKELRWPPFDIITSNPPYIPLSEYNELPSSVKDYEDRRALLGDPDSPFGSSDGRGLTFYRRIAHLVGGADQDGTPELIKPGGLIALEVGHKQSTAVRELMEQHANVQKTEVWKDAWGVERTVVCWK
ncbi:hypothetical protein M0805_000473 [Coniferiporia weirii]|nr:hypothetical protein M0805_000473 [Coniferiporia weirii]